MFTYSTATNGTSSIQNKSTLTFCAYLASTCATLLPFLLVQLIEAHSKAPSRCLMSPTTCLIAYWMSEPEVIHLVALTLSPSTISTVKPTSMANSSTLRHANSSATSLPQTARPFTVIVAITSPVEFLITAPNPVQAESSNAGAS